MTRAKLLCVASVCALLPLAATAFAGPATAEQTGATTAVAATTPSVSEGMVPALQRDLGLTPTQATARLAQESTAIRIESAARAAAADTYGGSWFEPKRGVLVVGLTTSQHTDAVEATGASVVHVAHTQARLDQAKTVLDTYASRSTVPKDVASWHVDPRSSSVTVAVQRGTQNRTDVVRFLDVARSAGPVTVAEVGARPQPLSAGTVGGDPYYIDNRARCSIGFSVHGGFVSAGHCGGVGSSVVGWDGSFMGNFAGSSFPGNDYSFIRITNGWWTAPVVLGWGTVSDQLVRGSNEAPVGSSICRSGSTTHWHCGTVLAKNETVNYAQGAVYQMTKTNVCAEPGDSGGSFITGDQAQGVTSGGWGNCSSGGETWFQPVNEILAVYGLSLVTA